MIFLGLVSSWDYLEKYRGKALKRSEMPKENFEDLKEYYYAFLNYKKIKIFTSVEE